MYYLKIIPFLIFSYLIGSFPSGYILYKLKTNRDIRDEGIRRNIGATNVFLYGGIRLGILTLIIDMIKGIIPIMIVKIYYPNDMILILCGIMAILGHVFPIYIGFKGGTGLATTIGILMVLMPEIMFIYLILFLLLLPILKRPALLGLIFMIFMPIFSYILQYSKILISINAIVGIMYFIVSLNHIKSMLKGSEYNEVISRLRIR